jgi:hypothetical protein
MSDLKKKFIRWYYGEFVNDPNGEVVKFGIERSPSVLKWEWLVKLVRKFWKF